jgi:hypothetical protein
MKSTTRLDMRPAWAPRALTRISATGMDRAGRKNARCVCLLGGRLRADDPKLVDKGFGFRGIAAASREENIATPKYGPHVAHSRG